MKLAKRLLISLILALSFFTITYPTAPIAYAQNQEIVYVASRNSNKYHHPSCVWVKKIKPENLVTFKSKEEAMRAGYIPCKVCTP